MSNIIPATQTPTGKIAKVNVELLSEGDLLSINQYIRIINTDNYYAFAEDLNDNTKFRVSLDLIQTQYWHGTQYTAEHKVSRTKLIQVLEHARDTIFTVTFRKKASQNDIASMLYNNKTEMGQVTNEREMHKYAKLIQNIGQIRTLTGILLSCEPFMGRSKVIDLQQPAGKNERQVDHRTLESIIIKNVRYYCT